MASTTKSADIEKLKKTTRLGDVHVADALRFFKSRNSTDFLTRKQFSEILKDLISQYTDYRPEASVFNSAVNQLYANFDRDSNGVVDFSELFCGLSMMCVSSNTENKLRATCESYDESSDGFMQ